jgi:hypothetical protein
VKKIKKPDDEPEEPEVDPAQLATLLSFPQMIESANFPEIQDTAPLALPNRIEASAILTEALRSRKHSVLFLDFNLAGYL